MYDAFDEVFGPDAVVSVRSSVVGTGTYVGDSAHDAFAGISDSFLYVTREQLLDRVRQCWASGFGPQALLYRAARGGTSTASRWPSACSAWSSAAARSCCSPAIR